MRRLGPDDDPDRLYVVTGGRTGGDDTVFDLVTLVVSEDEPRPGMQSEHVRILEMCRRPTAVVEISAALKLPVSVVRTLLCDLLDAGHITARHPRTARRQTGLHDPEMLKEVLVALRKL